MGCKSMDKAKQKHKKGLWSPDEDQKLKDYILKHGHGYWSSVPVNAGLQRNGKSCRLRWINYLRPGLKRGIFSVEEEEQILTLHSKLGNKWSTIAQHLEGRTDNEIKNHWHSYLKKRSTQNSAEKDLNNIQSSSSSILTNQEALLISSSTPRISLLESNDYFEGSEQSNSHMDQLPKLLFAEWLSLDQFCEQNRDNSNTTKIETYHENNYYDYNNLQDCFMHDLLFEEGAIGSSSNSEEIHQRSKDMIQPCLKFEENNNNNNNVNVNVLEDVNFVGLLSGQFDITNGHHVYL